jgi:hypothetical protein
MALHKAHRPATLKARLNRLERELQPYESAAQRQSREMATYWLATSERGAELLIDLEDACQRHGSILALTRSQAGRDLIDATVSDLYATLVPSEAKEGE